VSLCPVQQLRDRARRALDPGAVVNEHDLGHAPRGFQALGRHREVDQGGRLVGEVHQLEIGQAFREGPEQQPVRFHGGEVLAVDPDEIHRAAVPATGRFLRQNPRHRVGGVGKFHVAQAHPVVLGHPPAHPGDIAVDPLVAAPGVPEHRLTTGLSNDRLPAKLRALGAGHRQEQRQQQRSPPS
jgi:hypothetical protein